MSNGILYISCGLPGSGKSTFLKAHAKADEVIVSRDEIRFSLLKPGDKYFKYEDLVFDLFIERITKNINSGKNVYADATHLNSNSRKILTDALIAAGCDPIKVEAIYFDIPLEICLERNEKRKETKAYCPKSVIRRMASYISFPYHEFKTVWRVDVDGNVSKALERD